MRERRFASPEDYRVCRSMIETGSKSFYVASKLLPRQYSEPAFALYAFCRMADDSVDVDGGRPDAVASLRWRLGLIYAGDPVARSADRALADVIHHYEVPQTVLEALIDGFEWDVENRDYETLDELFGYCVRVAGTVGVMMALIMGVRDRDALARACDLGVAMQLTNIARDVGEDAREGRLYLPKSWLREERLDPETWCSAPQKSPSIQRIVARLLGEADRLYLQAEAGIAALPQACRPAILAARLIYAEIGRQIERQSFNAMDQRAVVAKSRKVLLLGQALLRSGSLSGSTQAPCLNAAAFLIDASACEDRKTELVDTRSRAEWVIDLFTRLEERDRMMRGGAAGQMVSRSA